MDGLTRASVGRRWLARLWRILRSRSASHYRLRRLFFVTDLMRAERRASRPPIVIYQPGKVGSSSVVRSLRALDLGTPVYHVHSLRQDVLRASSRWYRETLRGPKAQRAARVWEGQYLARRLSRNGQDRWDVITLVRDPVARDVSQFFQWMDRDVDPGVLEAARAGSHAALEELVARFHELFVRRPREAFRGDATQWFDVELGPILGIDVYEMPFPRGRGWEIYEGDRARALLVKLERLRDCAPDALHAFLGIPGLTVPTANARRDTRDGPLYARFRRSARLPQWYLDGAYRSRYATHFYSPLEIASFRREWAVEADAPPRHRHPSRRRTAASPSGIGAPS